MKSQILDYIEDKKLMSNFQFGFRHGYSTVTHLLHLTDTIREAIEAGSFGVLVALDFSKAFDRIDNVLLIQKLKNNFVSA